MVNIRELLVPLSIVAIVGSMLMPLPPAALDCLIVSNILFAFALLVSALYLSDPLKLSALPSMLLLATLYRLALNISTTRLILSRGSAGHIIEAFGSVVIQGNLAVGLVIFLMISLVQFIVIAKGSERVAEVAARFTLDALPGKQMAVDADVRAGLLDVEKARQKREELQIESRFYGALDGAMKFIKGDAIAGLVIVAVNIVGGFIVGMLQEGLDARTALSKYTLLTIGDGLVTQIPALLNSLAAGIVVTKVVRSDGDTLANELVAQLGQVRSVRTVLALLAFGMGLLPGMPGLPFFGAGLLLLLSAAKSSRANRKVEQVAPIAFHPRVPGVLELAISPGLMSAVSIQNLDRALEALRERVFARTGLLLMKPEITIAESGGPALTVLFRGIPAHISRDSAPQSESLATVIGALERVIDQRTAECVDDLLTRRTLDFFDREAPELVSAVVPAVATVTQLTVILRSLVREKISVRHFDVIMQAVAEAGPRHSGDRALLQDVRVALGRVIVAPLADTEGKLNLFTLEPVLDLAVVHAERGTQQLDSEILTFICSEVGAHAGSDTVVAVSKGARHFLADALELRNIRATVIAYEEIPKEQAVSVVYTAYLQDDGEFPESRERSELGAPSGGAS